MTRDFSRRLYHRVAPVYDAVAVAWEGIRRAAVGELDLRPGETALDLGCGTGLSFPWLVRGVGPGGRVVGVDQSPEMLARARRRAAARGWRNVELIEANAADVPLPEAHADLVFCCLAHDLVASPAVMVEAVRVLRPGGRLVIAGVKLSEGVLRWVLNPLVRLSAGLALARPITALPWEHAERALGMLQVRGQRLGTAYVAWGVKPPASPPAC